jgi:hypothetical protein
MSPEDELTIKIKKEEKDKIVTYLITRSEDMVSDYRNTIKHSGGLLTQSMTFAYSKGVNDIIKLITKEVYK